MGTQVHFERYSKPPYSMKEPNGDSSSSQWPRFYEDKFTTILQFDNRYVQQMTGDGHQEPEIDTFKQKILEHESVFKNQVYELHRLYQIQRNMMRETESKKVYSFRPPIEPALAMASCLAGNQLPPEIGAELEASKGRALKVSHLQLPADDYIDVEKERLKENHGTRKHHLDHCDAFQSASCLRGSFELVDLNEPIQIEKALVPLVDLVDLTSDSTESKSLSQPDKSKHASSLHGELHNREQFPHAYEGGFYGSMASSSTAQNKQSQVCSPYGSHPGSHSKEDDTLRYGFNSSGDLATLASNTPSSFPLSPFRSLQAPSVSYPEKHSYRFDKFTISGEVNTVSEALSQIQDQITRNFLAKSSGSSLQRTRSDIRKFNSVASNCLSSYSPKISCNQDGKSPAMAIEIDKEVPRSPSDDLAILEDLNVPVRKVDTEDHSPGLKSKPTGTDTKNARASGFSDHQVSENECEQSSVASTLSCKRKSRMIDINVACEPDEKTAAEEFPVENKEQKNGAPVREYIDLNFPVNVCVDPPSPCVKTGSPGYKSAIGFEDSGLFGHNMVPKERKIANLPSMPSSENKSDQDQDAIREAAEAVLAMSMSCPKMPSVEDTCFPSESSLAEALLFANSIASSENGTGNSKKGKDMDEFEEAALLLEDTKEDCLHKESTMELRNAEELGNSASNSKPRSAQTRRGRPRRNFQRDTLLGLSSLTRHEVTEDLQIFGDLMRIRGHRWSPGITTQNSSRNGHGRGRKRAVSSVPPLIQQLHNIKAGSDGTSLTGWGKNTKRLRRK